MTMEEEKPMGRSIETQTTHKKHNATQFPTEDLSIYGCKFEVFGIVKGVSFRSYTLRMAKRLEIRGWCNASRHTVIGEIQGIGDKFVEMKLWLEYTGSPTSRIDKCVFSQVKKLEEFTFETFDVRDKDSTSLYKDGDLMF